MWCISTHAGGDSLSKKLAALVPFLLLSIMTMAPVTQAQNFNVPASNNFTLSSIKAVALIRTEERKPPTEKEASIQLIIKVQTENSTGYFLQVLNGTITVGDEAYIVERGRGFVDRLDVIRVQVIGHERGKDERFHYGFSGLVVSISGQLYVSGDGIYTGGLKEKPNQQQPSRPSPQQAEPKLEKWKLDFVAQVLR